VRHARRVERFARRRLRQGKFVNRQLAFAKMVGLFTRLDETRAVPIDRAHTVLNHGQRAPPGCVIGDGCLVVG